MGKPTTNTSKTELPAYAQDAQQNLISQGQKLTEPFLQTPNYTTAGFNPDQTQGFDLVRQMTQQSFSNSTPWLTGSAAQATPAQMGTASLASAAQVTPGDIQAQMNPYIGSVISPTLGNMRRERDNSAAGISAKYAAQAGLGGSGEALATGQLNRSFGEQVASTVANLMSAGYDKATATALANAQLRQQAGLSNAAAQNSAAQFNAGSQNAASQFNAGAQNNMAAQSATINNAMLNDEQARQMKALQALFSSGQQQQTLAQSALDTPWTALQRLTATTPNLNNTGSSTTTEQSGNPLQTILGLGSLFLSDENEKKDVKKLGTDPRTGLPLYSYNYRDDPKSAPKRVGPMAQDIEKRNPDAVMTVGGKKVVRG